MSEIRSFYDPNRVGSLFYPDVAAIARDAEAAQLPPSAQDSVRAQLVAVDMQIDFCHPGGTLYVPGALDDVRRLIVFIYTHAERLTQITCSLDSHYPSQIFHAVWWADAAGRHPPPLTVITAEDVRRGRWRPLRDADWSLAYVEELEKQTKKELLIWPYHALLGGLGQTMDPELWSAVLWHALARNSQPRWWIKGNLPGTEHYSIVRPEVPLPAAPRDVQGEEFLRSLQEYDFTFIAGEAESHCVLETAEDIVAAFQDRPDVLSRVYLLQDCASPVAHPQMDFHGMALKRFEEFSKRGLRFMKSVDPLPFGRTARSSFF